MTTKARLSGVLLKAEVVSRGAAGLRGLAKAGTEKRYSQSTDPVLH